MKIAQNDARKRKVDIVYRVITSGGFSKVSRELNLSKTRVCDLFYAGLRIMQKKLYLSNVNTDGINFNAGFDFLRRNQKFILLISELNKKQEEVFS